MHAGITVLESSQPKELVMEMELQWDGNPNIVLDIKTRVGVALPIQVSNFFLHIYKNRLSD